MRDESRAKRVALVIVVSDSVFAGISTDESGEVLTDKLTEMGFWCSKLVVADEVEEIRSAVLASGYDLVVTTGGTGVGPRDVTPEAVSALIEKRLPGVEEAYRAYGLTKTPRAMLSRSLVGVRGKCLIICLPGSPKAVKDALEVMFPTLLHVYDVFEGNRH